MPLPGRDRDNVTVSLAVGLHVLQQIAGELEREADHRILRVVVLARYLAADGGDATDRITVQQVSELTFVEPVGVEQRVQRRVFLDPIHVGTQLVTDDHAAEDVLDVQLRDAALEVEVLSQRRHQDFGIDPRGQEDRTRAAEVIFMRNRSTLLEVEGGQRTDVETDLLQGLGESGHLNVPVGCEELSEQLSGFLAKSGADSALVRELHLAELLGTQGEREVTTVDQEDVHLRRDELETVTVVEFTVIFDNAVKDVLHLRQVLADIAETASKVDTVILRIFANVQFDSVVAETVIVDEGEGDFLFHGNVLSGRDFRGWSSSSCC